MHMRQAGKENKIWQTTFVAALIAAAGLLSAAPSAQAVPISADLSVTASVGYDIPFANSSLGGAGSQSGMLRVTQSGATSSSSFDGTSVAGGNPLNATLTSLGDGFGFIASALGANQGDAYGIGIDIGLSLSNSSLTTAHKITFNVAFGNTVAAAGTDAFAHSNFGVFDRTNNQTLFFTDLLSDTVNGNRNGGALDGDVGGTMSDSGPASFAITLLAGQSLFFDPNFHDLAWTLEGGAFSPDGSSAGGLDVFISIASIDDVVPPNPVPEPGTLALLGIALAGVDLQRRRVARRRSEVEDANSGAKDRSQTEPTTTKEE